MSTIKSDETPRKSAPIAGSVSRKSKSEKPKEMLKSRMSPEFWVTVASVETVLSITGHTKREPTEMGLVIGEPLTEANRALDEGLNLISEAVEKGPTGGVVWFKALEMFRGALSRAVKPFVGSTEKHVTPDLLPPLRTHTKF
jgi:hypothetical protein